MNASRLQKLGIKCTSDIPYEAIFTPESGADYGLNQSGIEKLRILGEVINEFLTEKSPEYAKVSKPQQAAEMLAPILKAKTDEEIWMLVMDKKMNLKKRIMVCQGIIDRVIVNTRKIVLETLNCNGSAVILAHNHPSGCPKPSKNDLEMTEKIRSALKVFDVELVDHIIISGNSYFSFNDNKVSMLCDK